ncbi:hypothetical protein AAIR29_10005 [Psychrobacter sp. FBL11]|uniref:Uncharacterized protein n=1 Tax=Psychrobacter saeujeotis TaxID=3143436 RepID=A0ABU9XAN2_9GAMM|nr:hypothetical protein [uncultured Psychrobacter sp.]
MKTANKTKLLKSHIILSFNQTNDVGSQQYGTSSDTIYNSVSGDFIISPWQ